MFVLGPLAPYPTSPYIKLINLHEKKLDRNYIPIYHNVTRVPITIMIQYNLGTHYQNP